MSETSEGIEPSLHTFATAYQRQNQGVRQELNGRARLWSTLRDYAISGGGEVNIGQRHWRNEWRKGAEWPS
jgi:hypothetical protein